jgi:holo-[acyl-carrier protein] synthase
MIGIGIDAVDVARFGDVLARRPGVADRIFTDAERATARGTRGLAARFAAKEAAMKAMGVGLGAFAWHDVEVVRDLDSGAPSLAITGGAATLAAELGVQSWRVSLTHTDLIAEAVVVAL